MPEPVLAKAALSIALIFLVSCRFQKREVVVYTSVDESYAGPVLKEFSRRTGIEVHPVFEAPQTAGLANRFAAENGRIKADVFWNGEFAQTMLLKDRGFLAPYASPSIKGVPSRYIDPQNYWSSVGARCRVLLIQTRLAPPKVPASLESLLEAEIPSHRIGIAFPLSGSTATHAAALYAIHGADSARWYFQRLRARGVRVLDGNSEVGDQIAGWRLAIGLTDSNTACKVVAKGVPVTIALPDQETIGTLLIPSTVALIKDSLHPAEGKRMIDYLVSAETEKRLIEAGFYQLSLRNVEKPLGCLEGRRLKLMNVSFDDIYRQLDVSRADLERIFVQ